MSKSSLYIYTIYVNIRNRIVLYIFFLIIVQILKEKFIWGHIYYLNHVHRIPIQQLETSFVHYFQLNHRQYVCGLLHYCIECKSFTIRKLLKRKSISQYKCFLRNCKRKYSKRVQQVMLHVVNYLV